jgi:hypothetical protein
MGKGQEPKIAGIKEYDEAILTVLKSGLYPVLAIPAAILAALLDPVLGLIVVVV